jgi:uncharacterized membrane protein
MQSLGAATTSANAVSADGSTVVGSGQGAFVWSSNAGLVPLVDPTGTGFLTSANGVSADGSVVVGNSSRGPYRWELGGTFARLIDLPPGTSSNAAWDVSADGASVVGYRHTAAGQEAYVWTSTGGFIGLGDIPGGRFESGATAISADGSTVIGSSISFEQDNFPDPPLDGWEAFIWTGATGMVSIGELPGGAVYARAEAVSGNGSVVVGASTEGLSTPVAFIWDAAHGMRRLQDVLVAEYGLDLAGWTLFSANGISADGNTIVGWGVGPDGASQGWIATVPEPGTALLVATGLAGLAVRRRRERTRD